MTPIQRAVEAARNRPRTPFHEDDKTWLELERRAGLDSALAVLMPIIVERARDVMTIVPSHESRVILKYCYPDAAAILASLDQEDA